MKSLLATFIVLAISFGNLYAFEKNDSTEVNGDILKKNPIAFQFAVGSFLTVTNFNNLNISAKKHLSQKFGVRLGLGFNFSDENLEEPGFAHNYYGESENNYSNIITSVLDFIYYVSPTDEVKAYVGLGPYFNYYERSDKRQSGSFGHYSPYYYYSYYSNVSIGANALIGIEWFASKKFSLFAEYNFAFTYSWIKDIRQYYESNYSDSNNLEGNETEFTGKQLKFGISVYF